MAQAIMQMGGDRIGLGMIVLMALALSVDAVAVSVTIGLRLRGQKMRHALKTGAFFGAFQALMPLIGFYAGRGVRAWIEPANRYVAMVLLVSIGVKMVWDNVRGGQEQGADGAQAENPTGTRTLLMLAVATSIDALAAGISLAMTDANLPLTVSLIGLTTFTLSVAAVWLGARLGALFQKRAGITGGLVLIGIGIKAVLDYWL